MILELVSQIGSAAAFAYAVWSAVAAARGAGSRAQMLSGLIVAVAILLAVRLIASFGGWGDWFVWVWLAGIAACAWAAFRAALRWPELSWSARPHTSPRSDVPSLAVGAVILLAVTSALVVPGMVLG